MLKKRMSDNVDDGWDDFEVDESGGVVQERLAPVVVADGWDNQDDFFDDDDDDDNDLVLNSKNGVGQKMGTSLSVTRPTEKATSMPPKETIIPAADQDAKDGWGEDDDLNVDDEDPQASPVVAPDPQQKTASKTFQNLENYLQMLPHLNSSVNAVLETEYNSSQKAFEVLEYFTERPGLVDYTIEKELPRMDYIVIEDSGMPLHEKDQIAAWMLQSGSEGSLLPRCANQSLLADLLQAMTGTDMLIRPQYLATAIATSCSFVLDAPQESVMVKSSLELSIPTEEGRWKVADLSVFCQLNVASPPSILYRLDVVKPTEKTDTWKAQMASAARLIDSMDLPEESFMNVSYQQSEDGMHYRDAFLQQSQNLIQNSAVGFRSALKEIDAVAGISTKLSKLPGFLPEDVMEAADRVHEQPAEQANPEHRPTSILGGFLSSGLTRLAQTVNLPEEDPEYYQNWQAQQQQQQQHHVARGNSQSKTHPQLYNRQEERVAPKLYNRQEPTPASTMGQRTSRAGPNLESSRVAPPDFAPAVSKPHGDRQQAAPQLYKGNVQASQAPIQGQVAGSLRDQPHVKDPRKQLTETNNDEGWDMEDDDLFSADELAAMETKSPWGEQSSTPHQALGETTTGPDDIPEEGWVYDPETDIVPTRKRWVNPRPGPRTLEYFLAGQ